MHSKPFERRPDIGDVRNAHGLRLADIFLVHRTSNLESITPEFEFKNFDSKQSALKNPVFETADHNLSTGGR